MGSRNSSVERKCSQPIDLRVATYVEPRGSSGGILGERLNNINLPANGAPGEQVLVARVPVLPIVPNLVNHLFSRHISPFPRETDDKSNRMVKVERGVCARGKRESINKRASDTIALTIRRPLWSKMAHGRSQPKRTPSRHIPSMYFVYSRVRSVEVLKRLLKVDVISCKPIHDGFDDFTRERSVHHQRQGG